MSKMETALKIGQQIAKDPKPAVMVCDILAIASTLTGVSFCITGRLIDEYCNVTELEEQE